jgi:hypothetical protein
MKVSQIRFSELGSCGLIGRFYIELPKTDALLDLTSNRIVLMFIEAYGDLEVVQSGNRFNVPAFAAGREKFTAAKTADCAIWGCE